MKYANLPHKAAVQGLSSQTSRTGWIIELQSNKNMQRNITGRTGHIAYKEGRCEGLAHDKKEITSSKAGGAISE